MKQDNDLHDELKGMGSKLGELPQAMPYQVPEGYFDNPGIGIREIMQDDAASQLFAGTKMPATSDVPVNYFDRFPDQMLKAARKSEAQYIPNKRRLIPITIVKWAAAAAIVIATGAGAYNILSRGKDTGTEQILAAVPDNDVHDYLQNTYTADVDRIMNNNSLVSNMQLENKDIINYLDETGWDVAD